MHQFIAFQRSDHRAGGVGNPQHTRRQSSQAPFVPTPVIAADAWSSVGFGHLSLPSRADGAVPSAWLTLPERSSAVRATYCDISMGCCPRIPLALLDLE